MPPLPELPIRSPVVRRHRHRRQKARRIHHCRGLGAPAVEFQAVAAGADQPAPPEHRPVCRGSRSAQTRAPAPDGPDVTGVLRMFDHSRTKSQAGMSTVAFLASPGLPPPLR